MNVDEYVQTGEKVYCETDVKKGGSENAESGTLACTDTRLIFTTGSSVLDLDLNAIEELEYTPSYTPSERLAYAFLIAAGGVVGWLLAPEVSIIPSDLRILTLLPVFFGIVYAGEVFLKLSGPTLVVRTRHESHRFRDGKLADFPHAIRGASD